MSPVRSDCSKALSMRLAFSGSVSLLILAWASAIFAALAGSVAWMYFMARSKLDSRVDIPFCIPVLSEA
ncbi:hypothetical protein D3C78_1771610 [compost metagenome]